MRIIIQILFLKIQQKIKIFLTFCYAISNIIKIPICFSVLCEIIWNLNLTEYDKRVVLFISAQCWMGIVRFVMADIAGIYVGDKMDKITFTVSTGCKASIPFFG